VIVEIEQLTVKFRQGWRRVPIVAVDDLTLNVREGEVFALLGPNGAGKSTTFYCILGLLRPSSGRVRLFGQTPRPGCAAFARVAYLPEEPHYHEYLTVWEAVTYYVSLYGAPPPRAQVAEVLDRLDLGRARDQRVASCSKGMKQKVGIAQCLLHQPKLLMLDEPMRGLDPVTVKQFRDVLIDLNRQGVTIVMNSHMLAEVQLVATRAAVLANGRLVGVDETPKSGTLEDWFFSILKPGADACA
jgi:ABC-2 type transport system ATP-binding protein